MTKSEKAKELFLEGYNCAQSLTGAYASEMGLDFSAAVKLASSFGGGMGRMREVCGAVSGMFLAAGAIYGYADPKNFSGKKEHYQRIQFLAAQFKQETGSIVCRELLGDLGKDASFVPGERTKEYYKKRPCAELVGLAAGILEEYIQECGLPEES